MKLFRENILPILKGMAFTFSQAFTKPVTVPYPEQKKPVKDRFKGRHVLNRYENGLEKCIGCALCAAACPADAIFVEASENTDEERYSPGDRYASTYEINLIRCIYCGFCADACPTEAVTLGHEYELSYLSRRDAIITREELLLPVPANGQPTPQVTEAGKFDRAIPEMKDPV